MIPLLLEQSSAREPISKVKVAWGGDLALANGLISVTATASSETIDHAASKSVDGDRTLLNDSYWESTNADGRAFSLGTDGYIFRDLFNDVTNWTAETTIGATVSTHTCINNSPWLDFTLNSSVINTLVGTFRRCTTNLPFSASARTYAFSMKVPNSRHHVSTGTDIDQLSIVLCPTVTVGDPLSEAELVSVVVNIRENYVELCGYKKVAAVTTQLFSAVVDESRVRDIRVTLDSTNLVIWDSKEGILFSGAHGLTMGSWGSCYIYAMLRTYNTELARGSIGNLSVFRGFTQTFAGLAANTQIVLQNSGFMNTNFSSLLQSDITQELVEDFERYAVDAQPYDWYTFAVGGASVPTLTVQSINGHKGLRLMNTANEFSYAKYSARRFFDFDATWDMTLPDFSGEKQIAYADRVKGTPKTIEDFESYNMGDLMTAVGDWTFTAYTGAETNQFLVEAGKRGRPSVGGGWGWYHYNPAAANNWRSLRLQFKRKTTERLSVMIRHNSTSNSGYSFNYLNAGEISLRRYSGGVLGTNTDLLLEQSGGDYTVPTPDTEDVKMEITGTDEVIIRIWLGTNIYREFHDKTSSRIQTGTFGFFALNDSCAIDDVRAETFDESNTQFNQLIRSTWADANGSIVMNGGANSGIDLGTHTRYNINTGSASISGWIKNADIAANKIFLSKGWYAAGGFYIQTNGSNWEIIHNTTTVLRTNGGLSGTQDVWTHWVFTKTGGGVWRVYKNGVELSYLVQTGGDPSSVPAAHLFVGDGYGSVSVNARLCDLHWYNRVLVQSEITALAFGTNFPVDHILNVRCDELSGTTANDQSSVKNNGTYQNVTFSSDVPNPYGYILRHNVVGSRFYLYRDGNDAGGQTTLLQTTTFDYSLSGSTRYYLRCIANGNRVRVWINATLVADYVDNSAPRYSGYFGLQLKSGQANATTGYGYISNLVIKDLASSLPEYWQPYNSGCHVTTELYGNDMIVIYPELGNAKTSGGSNNFVWVSVADGTGLGVFDRDHRGGVLMPNVSAHGGLIHADSTIQTIDIPFSVCKSGDYYINIRHRLDSNHGKYQIWIDGLQVGGDIDTYGAASWVWGQPSTTPFTTLSTGNHTLQIRKLATKNASSSDYHLEIDEIILRRLSTLMTGGTIHRSYQPLLADNNVVMITSNKSSIQNGSFSGLKQEFVIPKNQNLYVRASVYSPTAGVTVRLGESVTGQYSEFVLTSTGWNNISFSRKNFDGGIGDVFLYISSFDEAVVGKGIATVYVHNIEAYADSDCFELLKYVDTPYTSSTPTFAGVTFFKKSNIVIDSELFSHCWRSVGTVTVTADDCLNPEENGTSSKLAFGATSYIYHPIDVNYGGRNYTLSFWVKSSSQTEIYVGVLEDLSNPTMKQISLFQVDQTWTRQFMILRSADLDIDSLKQQLNVVFGVYGFGVRDNVDPATVNIWGVQLVEDELDLYQYQKSTESQLVSDQSHFENTQVWQRDFKIFDTFSTGTTLNGRSPDEGNGNTWVDASTRFVITNKKLYRNGTPDHTTYFDLGVSAYCLEWDMDIPDLIGTVSFDAGMDIRYINSTDYLYLRIHSNQGGIVELLNQSGYLKRVPLGPTFVYNDEDTPNLRTVHFKVIVKSDRIKVWIDGVQYMDFASTENNAATKIGPYCWNGCNPGYRNIKVSALAVQTGTYTSEDNSDLLVLNQDYDLSFLYKQTGSYLFDGSNDMVVFDNVNIPTGNDTRTFTAWIKPTNLVGDHCIVSSGAFAMNQQFSLAFLTANPTKLSVWGHTHDVTGTFVFATGNWYHVAVTYNSVTGALKTYVNGIIDINTTTTVYATATTGSLVIGCGTDLATGPFAGNISDVRIFNRELSQGEVMSIKGGIDIASGLKFYAKCNESLHVRSYDSSTYLNHGVMKGVTLSTFLSTDAPLNAPAVLTGKGYVASIWAKTVSGTATVRMNLSTDDDTLATTREVSLTTSWKKFTVSKLFDTTARKVVKFSFGTSALGGPALSTCEIMVKGAALYTNQQTDHQELWEGTSNLILNSEDFTSWARDGGITVTADQFANPQTFQKDADKIETVANDNAVYQVESANPPDGSTPFTFSVWLRADADTTAQLEVSTLGDVHRENISVTTYWQRFSLTVTLAAGANSWCGVRILDTADVLYAWGGQYEKKFYPTRYEKTTVAAAPRTATTLKAAVPASVAGTTNPFEITWRGSALSDDITSSRVHTLFSLGNGAAASRLVVYLKDGLLYLDITNVSGTTYSASVMVPEIVDLYHEFSVSVARVSDILWKLTLIYDRVLAQNTTELNTNTGITAQSFAYLGTNPENANFGNFEVAEFVIWARALTEVERASNVSSNRPLIYSTDTRVASIIPFKNRDYTLYTSGGSSSFTFSRNVVYPWTNYVSFKKNLDMWETLESPYSVWGGSSWNYVFDYLLLTFANDVTFNRLKVYQYPNRDASLQTPYASGKGGLRNYILEYWDGSKYVPFYRTFNSSDDLDKIDLTQLATNGDFEDYLSGVTVTNPTYVSLALATINNYSGVKHLSVTSTYRNPETWWGVKFPLFVIPGETYTISCRVANTGFSYSTRNSVRLQVATELGITTVSETLTSLDYVLLSTTYTAPLTLSDTTVWVRIMADFTNAVEFVNNMSVDDIKVTSTVSEYTTTRVRLSVQDTQVSAASTFPRVTDPARVVEVQMFNFVDETAYVVDDDIQVTYKKTPSTNFIAPSYFQVRLSNTSKRFSAKNAQSPIYGYTQPDGRGFIRAGSLIEIYGGYRDELGNEYTTPLVFGIIGSEANPSSNTGIENSTSNEDVLLVGGDDVTQLNRTKISDDNVVTGLSLEQILTRLCQLSGFAVQDMQFDTSGTTVPYSWIGEGTGVLDEINKIIEASHGAFFASPNKRTLFYYDGTKFKSWIQATKQDFDAGVKSNVTTDASIGNVQLDLHRTQLNWGSVTDYGLSSQTGINLVGNGALSIGQVFTSGNKSIFSMKGYHFTSMTDWLVTGKVHSAGVISNGEAFLFNSGYPTKYGIRTDDTGAGNPSIFMIDGVELSSSDPKLDWKLEYEDGSKSWDGEFRLINSGTGRVSVSPNPHAVIPIPPTQGATARYKIYFTLTQHVWPGQYIYVYFPAGTVVPNNPGVNTAFVTIDGAAKFDLVTTESAYLKISVRVGMPNIVWAGSHCMDVNIAVGIQNPNSYNAFSLRTCSTNEGETVSDAYYTNYNNGYPEGTYYFSARRRFTDGSHFWRGALYERSDAFIVGAGDWVQPLVSIGNDGDEDKYWDYTEYFAVKNPANPDDALYNYQVFYYKQTPSWRLLSYNPDDWQKAYYKPGKNYSQDQSYPGGWNGIYASGGWQVEPIFIPSEVFEDRSKKCHLSIIFPKDGGEQVLRTREAFYPSASMSMFIIRHAYFGGPCDYPNHVALDEIAYGVTTFYTSGTWVSTAFDTGGASPIWGKLTGSVVRQLDISKGERIVLKSQTSDDNVNWYGQAGLNQWDTLATLSSTYGPFGYRITSPSKRYIRFKVEMSTQDQWTSPGIQSLFFTHTLNGTITSQVLDATANVTSWEGFGGTTLKPSGTNVTFETLSSDDSGFSLTDPAGWVAAVPGEKIQSAVKRYLKWRATLTTTDGEVTPTLSDVTINWVKNLQVPSESRTYSYDTRILSFDPKTGFPYCNKCEVKADFYLLSTVINSVTARWNGSGVDSAKTCGDQMSQYPSQLSLTSESMTLYLEGSAPTLTPNNATYSTYPRAVVVTIGGVSYGVFGYDAGAVKEGTTYTWAGVGGGNLSLTFSGTGKQVTVTINATGTVTITSLLVYAYNVMEASSFDPSQLVVKKSSDTTSLNLYNQSFLQTIENKYVYSPNMAQSLADLIVSEDKFVKEYGQLTIPIEFSINLQTKICVTSPAAGWDNQWAEIYEVTHSFSDHTTKLMIKEK